MYVCMYYMCIYSHRDITESSNRIKILGESPSLYNNPLTTLLITRVMMTV